MCVLQVQYRLVKYVFVCVLQVQYRLSILMLDGIRKNSYTTLKHGLAIPTLHICGTIIINKSTQSTQSTSNLHMNAYMNNTVRV